MNKYDIVEEKFKNKEFFKRYLSIQEKDMNEFINIEDVKNKYEAYL